MADGWPTTLVSGSDFLVAGEEALARGASRQGFDLLHRASALGVAPAEMPRLVCAYAAAGRLQSRQQDVLDWIERIVEDTAEPGLRALLLTRRVVLCHGVDFPRVHALLPEALALAEAVGDEESCASVLSCAAAAAYRRGDAHAVADYAEQASRRLFQSGAARFEVLRANMFAAIVAGDVEQALNLSIKARAVARELHRTADVANESCNLAECYLELGCPIEARACAEQGRELARACGYHRVEIFGQVLAAVATAETGDVDGAIEQFERIPFRTERFFMVDAATAQSYWLLERGAEGDARAACELASEAVDRARQRGMSNRLTPLYGNIARGLARQGRREEALAALAHARQAVDRTEPANQLFLTQAVAEVLPDSDPARQAMLTEARARILRQAAHREDPHTYCTEVCLHRRLLDLSGGIPADLPHGPINDG